MPHFNFSKRTISLSSTRCTASTLAPVVELEVHHVDELHGCKENGVFVIIVWRHLKVVSVSHCVELIAESIVFLCEVVQKLTMFAFYLEFHVLARVTRAVSVRSSPGHVAMVHWSKEGEEFSSCHLPWTNIAVHLDCCATTLRHEWYLDVTDSSSVFQYVSIWTTATIRTEESSVAEVPLLVHLVSSSSEEFNVALQTSRFRVATASANEAWIFSQFSYFLTTLSLNDSVSVVCCAAGNRRRREAVSAIDILLQNERGRLVGFQVDYEAAVTSTRGWSGYWENRLCHHWIVFSLFKINCEC